MFCQFQSPGGSLSSHTVRQCALACVENAKEMVLILGSSSILDDGIRKRSAWWHRVYYAYTAATVLLAAAKLRPDIFSPSSISKPWNEAKSIIRYNTRYGVSARRCEAALQILCSKLSRNPNESGNPSDSIVMDHADVDNFNFDADHCQWISSLPGEIVY